MTQFSVDVGLATSETFKKTLLSTKIGFVVVLCVCLWWGWFLRFCFVFKLTIISYIHF